MNWKKFQLKKFLATPKGKLTGALALLGACWGGIALYYFSSFLFDVPSNQRLAAMRMELKRQQRLFESTSAGAAEADLIRKRYEEMIATAWRPEDGNVETELRLKVSEAARSGELKLNQLGSVRIDRINNELFFAELDVSATGPLSDVIRFISTIGALKPEIRWKRLDIRPDMRAARRNATLSIVNLAEQKDEQEVTPVNFSGSLRVLGYEGKAPARAKGGNAK